MAIVKNSTNGSMINNQKEDLNNISKPVSKKIDILSQKIDNLYKDIYITRPDNKHNMDDVIDRLDSSIDKLQSTDVSISGMSEILRRIGIKNSTNTENLVASVEDLFNDQGLINTLFVNEEVHKYIAAQNYQYDLICRYLPKLEDALEIKRDNVLSADNFSKNFLNPKSVNSSVSELEVFSANCKRLNKNYDIEQFVDDTYMNCSKYGEDFIYIVPYNEAFKRLLKRSNYRQNNGKLSQMSFCESLGLPTRERVSLNSVNCVTESFMESDEYKNYISNLKDIYKIDDSSNCKFKGCEVNLHFNDTGVVLDSVNEAAVIRSKSDLAKLESLSSVYETAYDGNYNSVFKDVKKRNKLSTSQDGLILPDTLMRDPNKIDKDFNGAVVERLSREDIVPVYIGTHCLGYYYFDFKEDKSACGFCGGHHTMPGISNSQSMSHEMTQDQQELAIRFIAKKISANIDTHFINANKDLKEEIYSILQYNDKFDLSRTNDIGVTFIPAEDIIHCYFKLDETTHRGISDLQRALVPAMLYILLYLTDLINKISRSSDKRIYYVKQNVETNVARTMMNVVAQIKKGNMGMRQIESMNNILNIVGKYNDFIIPKGASGDAPIEFEVMQGQNVETPTELMDKMQEEAINTIMPIELVNSTLQQDFATKYTMSNVRFLKSVYNRQYKAENWISTIYTKIYNYEYNENYPFIDVILPPPAFLMMTNTQQMLDNAVQLAEKIADVELSNESDELKAEFKKLHVRNNLSAYIDFDTIERLKNVAKFNLEANKVPKADEGSDSENGFMPKLDSEDEF